MLRVVFRHMFLKEKFYQNCLALSLVTGLSVGSVAAQEEIAPIVEPESLPTAEIEVPIDLAPVPEGNIFAPENMPGVDEIIETQAADQEVVELAPDLGPISERTARLRALDKVTARVSEFTVGLDEMAIFENLEVTLRTCNKRPPEEPPETTAFLEIIENKPNGDQEPVFTGWMFASSPALNALEHSVYDVWVIDCKILTPDASN